MTIAQLMTSSPIAVNPKTSLVECAQILHDADIRHLPVVDAWVLTGVVTDTEVFRRVAMVGGNGAWVVFEPDDVDLTAADLMVRPMVAGLDEGESEVLTRLAEPDFDAVVIVDKSGGPVGIITEHDGVRMAADQLGALPKVGEVAHAQWVSAQPKEALRNALGRLVAQRARHLLVEDEGGLKGVVSLRDLIGDDKEAPVRSVMREHVITVAPDVSVADAARLMLRERIGVLPVVGSEGVIGVVNRPLLIKLLL